MYRRELTKSFGLKRHSYFEVEEVDVECFEVDNGQLMQCRVGFSIAVRRGRGGVVQILEVGRKASDQVIAQKYGVLACVNKLTTFGYSLPTYSSMKIQSINVGSYHDLAGFCARMARNNRDDVVSRSRTPSLYQDLLLLESLILISIFSSNT
jgi:hypothetical protein